MGPEDPDTPREDAPEPPPPVPPPQESLFGEPDIPMPAATRASDRQRQRDGRRNVDLDLGRIKRRKRYGLFLTIVTVLFVAFVVMPVTWVGAYLFIDPPSNVLMMQRAAEGEEIKRYPVPINRISPYVIRSVIAAEDATFCTHDGFDVKAIQEAMESNARGGRRRRCNRARFLRFSLSRRRTPHIGCLVSPAATAIRDGIAGDGASPWMK